MFTPRSASPFTEDRIETVTLKRMVYLHVALCIHLHLEFPINIEFSFLCRDVLTISISIWSCSRIRHRVIEFHFEASTFTQNRLTDDSEETVHSAYFQRTSFCDGRERRASWAPGRAFARLGVPCKRMLHASSELFKLAILFFVQVSGNICLQQPHQHHLEAAFSIASNNQ